jgi:hypothetical protein
MSLEYLPKKYGLSTAEMTLDLGLITDSQDEHIRYNSNSCKACQSTCRSSCRGGCKDCLGCRRCLPDLESLSEVDIAAMFSEISKN